MSKRNKRKVRNQEEMIAFLTDVVHDAVRKSGLSPVSVMFGMCNFTFAMLNALNKDAAEELAEHFHRVKSWSPEAEAKSEAIFKRFVSAYAAGDRSSSVMQ